MPPGVTELVRQKIPELVRQKIPELVRQKIPERDPRGGVGSGERCS